MGDGSLTVAVAELRSALGDDAKEPRYVRTVYGEATIEDLGSKNGTFVGDGASPVSGPTVLPDDSRLRLGRVLLVFRCSPEAGSTMTERCG